VEFVTALRKSGGIGRGRPYGVPASAMAPSHCRAAV